MQFKYHVNIKYKNEKGFCHQFQISCCKFEWSELIQTSKTLTNDKNVKSKILTCAQLLLFEELEKRMLHWSNFVI